MTPVTKRYTPEEAVVGLQVDVATKGRSEFFGRVAVGEILEGNEKNLKLHADNLPNDFVLKSKAVTTAKKNKRRLVKIKGVLHRITTSASTNTVFRGRTSPSKNSARQRISPFSSRFNPCSDTSSCGR